MLEKDEPIYFKRKRLDSQIRSLQNKPRRFPYEDQQLENMKAEYKRLMRCGDIKNV